MHMKQRGFLYVTVIIALMVMVITGLTFLASSMQQMNDSTRALNYLEALSMADAGANYVIWRQKWAPVDQQIPNSIISSTPHPDYSNIRIISSAPTVTLPYDGWGMGTASMWIFNLPTGDGYDVIAKGMYHGFSRQIRVVMRAAGVPAIPSDIPPLPDYISDYALYSDGLLTASGSSAVYDGNIGSNTSLITAGAANVYGNFYIAEGGYSSINKNSLKNGGKLIVGKKMALPPWTQVTMQEWKAAAPATNRYLSTDTIPWSNLDLFNMTSDDGLVGNDIIFIDTPDTNGDGLGDGTVEINNTTFGDQGTVVVNGILKITSHVYSPVTPNKTTGLVMVANELDISGNGNFQALMCAKIARLTGTPSIYGGVIAKETLFLAGDQSVYYRRAIPPTTPPGGGNTGDDGTAQAWTTASWELL